MKAGTEQLATLLREVIEAQMQLAMAIVAVNGPDRPLPPILTERVSERLRRIAEAIDARSSEALPPELARSLHTTALRLQGLGDRAGRGG